MSIIPGTIIEWASNPLTSRIILDERGREEFRLRALIRFISNEAIGVSIHLDEKFEMLDIERAKKELATLWSDSAKTDAETRSVLVERFNIDDILPELLKTHCGDCISVACSCCKCVAEDIAETDTIAGLHWGGYIAGAFAKNTRTLTEALQYIQKPIVANATWQEEHLIRWNREREGALIWLMFYHKTHPELL
jgi:hypothetical protein